MGKSALAFGYAFFLFWLLTSAQQVFARSSLDSLNSSQPQFPSLSLENAEPFSFPSTLAWIDSTSSQFLPSLPQAAPHRIVAAAADPRDSSKQVADLPKSNPLDYVHGEVSVLYGHSIGKFGGDTEAGYILGEVGDDKLQINVGATYDRWSGRVPRFGR